MMFNQLSSFPDWAHTIVLPLNRWLHMISSTLLVGGTLFYEFVIPKAIEDLKPESQLAVMGRVRWIFRRIVLISATLLVLTGIISSWRNWPTYNGNFGPVKPWWIIHTSMGVLAMVIAILLTIGDRVPRHPIAWLRVNFVIMLVAIFVADITVYVRQSVKDQLGPSNQQLELMPLPDTPKAGLDQIR
jgi:uncharacterized membrane protein